MGSTLTGTTRWLVPELAGSTGALAGAAASPLHPGATGTASRSSQDWERSAGARFHALALLSLDVWRHRAVADQLRIAARLVTRAVVCGLTEKPARRDKPSVVGGLVFGVTPENILTHPSTPRNRLLLETVTALQVAERTGQGIDRAYRELLRTGKVPPTFGDDGYQVRVLVQGGTGNDAFARFVAELAPELGGDMDVLLALSHLRDARNIDAARLAAIAQRSTSEAQGVLERLALARLVAPTARTAARAHPTYVLTGSTLASLGRAVRYHVRRADETDRKVADHIRE